MEVIFIKYLYYLKWLIFVKPFEFELKIAS